ncbi:MAG: hypothetical protein R6W90_15270 [Ignavibacteriaceae bacterium]
MELIEIILYVLKLFSLSSFILLSLSYFFFKLKDRARIKPYMLVNTDPEVYEVPQEKENEDVLNYRKFTRKFKVINDARIAKVRPNLPEKQHYYKPKMQVVPAEVRSSNIYNMYSPATSEPMHKLKIGVS